MHGRIAGPGLLAAIGLLLLAALWLRISNSEWLADREALLQAQGPDRWVVIGSYDERWPARVVSMHESLVDLRFEHRGVEHSYILDGPHRLRVVYLLDREEQAVAVVLRSAQVESAAPGEQTAPRPERENVEQGVRR